MATWPARRAIDYSSGGEARTLGQETWDRTRCAMSRGVGVRFGPVTRSNTAWGTVASRSVRIPSAIRGGDKVKVTCWVRRSAGSGAVSFRASIDSTHGTAQTLAVAGGELLTTMITVPDNTWAGQRKTFAFEGQTDAGTTGEYSLDRVGACIRFGD